MKKILLNSRDSIKRYAIVDDEDFELLSKSSWHLVNKHYATRMTIDGSTKLMHRLILNVPKEMHTDHINHNGLDNRKSNLRICSNSENIRNRKINKNNTSGYKGVSWSANMKKWRSAIGFEGKVIVLGHFKDKKKAAISYNLASDKYHKEYSYKNII